MILLIDNYDSFTYNLYQMMGATCPDITVIRNDALNVREALALDPSHIVLSPGPGRPADAGITEELVTACADQLPVLGICLGHQAICEAAGATIGYAGTLMHGKASEVKVDPACPLFAGLGKRVQAGRYHSLAVLPETLPETLVPVAWADDGELMAVAHRELPVYGLQFHPESILTPAGAHILSNYLRR